MLPLKPILALLSNSHNTCRSFSDPAVKDLGKNLAKFVLVFNCTSQLDYKSVGRMFSGLVQSGGWGCFGAC